jgi:hypothetical protein
MDLGAGLVIGRMRCLGVRGGQLGQKFVENFITSVESGVASLCASRPVSVSISSS